MQQEAKEINLDNLDGGGLMELASREFHKIISIEVKPDRKGQSADIAYSVKSTLAGPDKAKTTAFIAMAPGSSDISLFGVDVRQADLFPEGEQQPGPVAMPSKVVNQ
jgi:hypothetical protein